MTSQTTSELTERLAEMAALKQSLVGQIRNRIIGQDEYF